MDENDLFVIAAGGSGAKVVESLIHLCAAGLTPTNVHVLLVDGDAANGNRKRTIETWNAYKRVQPWPWRVKPKITGASEIQLFPTHLEIYSLAEQFSSAESGSLRPLVQEDSELHEALGVLLDDQELDMNMQIGFTGRPNLGCLVMNHYLSRHLRSHDRARLFIQALEDSARKSVRSAPRVVVIGSVFGGTGASLLPVARSCVKSVFKEPDANRQPRNDLYERMLWGKIMLLPYFRPQGGVNLGMVNPARHFVDTSGALWYYGLSQSDSEPTYLVGSDSPHKRRVIAVGGAMGQNNPPVYHELLTALAILDFYAKPEIEGKHSVRHFSEAALPGTLPESNTLINLPGPTGVGQEVVRTQLARLLQLAAFSIAWRVAPVPEFHKGLFQYAKESKITGWDRSVHDSLSGDRESLCEPSQHILEYFARLLLWGKTVLSGEDFNSSGLDYNSNAGQYASLHNTLCFVDQEEIEVPINGNFPQVLDNIAAKICRLGLVGLVKEDAAREDRDHRGHGLDLERNILLQGGQTIKVGLPSRSLESALVAQGFDKAEKVTKWFAEFQLSPS